MTERSIVIYSAAVGAALGGIAGYLFLTDAGRRLRHELAPQLDELARDLATLQDTIVRAREAALQGWRVIGEVAGSQRQQWTDGSQTAPY